MEQSRIKIIAICLLLLCMTFLYIGIESQNLFSSLYFLNSVSVAFQILALIFFFFFLSSIAVIFEAKTNMNNKQWPNIDDNAPIKIDQKAYNAIKKSIGSMPAETIGYIFGDPSNYHIRNFIPCYNEKYHREEAYHDKNIEEIIQNNTNLNTRFLGTVHSHPIDDINMLPETKIGVYPRTGKLSDADIESSKKFISYCKSYSDVHYGKMPFILDCIVFSIPDNDNVFRIFVHKVFEGNKQVKYFLPYEII